MIHAIHANRIRPDKGSRSFSILGYIVMAAITLICLRLLYTSINHIPIGPVKGQVIAAHQKAVITLHIRHRGQRSPSRSVVL